MPDQPQYTAQVQPNVQPSAEMPGTTPDAMGANVGEALENTGRILTRVTRDENLQIRAAQERATQQANATAHLGADNQMQAFVQDRLANPKSGLIYQPLGADAISASDKFLADYDEQQAKVAASLTNDQQREAFSRSSQALRFDAQRVVDKYAHTETERHADETDKGAIALASNAAVLNAGTTDPELNPEHQIEKVRAIIADSGHRHGLADPLIVDDMNKAESQIHLGIIDKLLVTDRDQQAKAWFDDHKEELTADDRTMAEKKLEIGTLNGDAQRIARELIHTTDGKVDSRENIDVRMDEDKRLQGNPRLADAVARRTDHLLQQNDRAIAEGQRQAFNAAAQIAQDPNNAQGIANPQLQQARLNMSPEQWSHIETMAKRDVPITDPVKAYQFRMLLANPTTRTAAANTDLTSLPWLDPRSPEFKEIGDRQAEIIKSGAAAPDSWSTVEEAKKQALKAANIAPGDPQEAAFGASLMARIKKDEDFTGKKKTGDEIQKIANEMLVSDAVYRRGVFYNSKTPAYQVKDADLGSVTLSDAQLRTVDPARADQFQANVRARAAALGITPERIPPAAIDQARALMQVAYDRKAAGDVVGMKEAMARVDAALHTSVYVPARLRARSRINKGP